MLPLLKNISKYIYKEEKQKQKNKPISFIDNPLYKKQYIFFCQESCYSYKYKIYTASQ